MPVMARVAAACSRVATWRRQADRGPDAGTGEGPGIPTGRAARDHEAVVAVLERPLASRSSDAVRRGADDADHNVVGTIGWTPRRVRVGLGILIALGLWALLILAGCELVGLVDGLLANRAGRTAS